MSRCEKHDIEIGSCADCSPRPGQANVTARICPVCGDSLSQSPSQEAHLRHECSGPRVVLGGDVQLVSWGPDWMGYEEQVRAWKEDHE